MPYEEQLDQDSQPRLYLFPKFNWKRYSLNNKMLKSERQTRYPISNKFKGVHVLIDAILYHQALICLYQEKFFPYLVYTHQANDTLFIYISQALLLQPKHFYLALVLKHKNKFLAFHLLTSPFLWCLFCQLFLVFGKSGLSPSWCCSCIKKN